MRRALCRQRPSYRIASAGWSIRPVGECRITSESLPIVYLARHGETAWSMLRAGPVAPVRGAQEVLAVGHRVVHRGIRYTAAVLITPEVRRVIGELAELAPLHNPVSLAVITAAEKVLPGPRGDRRRRCLPGRWRRQLHHSDNHLRRRRHHAQQSRTVVGPPGGSGTVPCELHELRGDFANLQRKPIVLRFVGSTERSLFSR